MDDTVIIHSSSTEGPLKNWRHDFLNVAQGELHYCIYTTIHAFIIWLYSMKLEHVFNCFKHDCSFFFNMNAISGIHPHKINSYSNLVKSKRKGNYITIGVLKLFFRYQSWTCVDRNSHCWWLLVWFFELVLSDSYRLCSSKIHTEI